MENQKTNLFFIVFWFVFLFSDLFFVFWFFLFNSIYLFIYSFIILFLDLLVCIALLRYCSSSLWGHWAVTLCWFCPDTDTWYRIGAISINNTLRISFLTKRISKIFIHAGVLGSEQHVFHLINDQWALLLIWGDHFIHFTLKPSHLTNSSSVNLALN